MMRESNMNIYGSGVNEERGREDKEEEEKERQEKRREKGEAEIERG